MALFLAAQTQWRAVATAGGPIVWIGLDYAAVEVLMRRLSLDVAFEDLQVIEDAALAVLNEGSP